MRAQQMYALLAITSACVTACTVGPNYQPPRASVPAQFDAGAMTQPAPHTADAPPVDITVWWRSLNDPILDSLVDRAVKENLDLDVALMRLQEARASELVVAGGVMPFVEASGGAARGSGTNSTKGRVSPPLNAATSTTGLKEITQVVGFDAGWEIDIFGRFRRQLEAAAADTQAAAEARNAVLVTLVSDVARAYIDLRTAQTRLAISEQNIALAEQTLDIVQQRFDRGLTNELDLALARRQLATERADVAPFQYSIAEYQRRLAVLLGQSPEALHKELENHGTIPQSAPTLTLSAPVDLLRRRPDIREAERQLAAENARIGIATADLFPRVAITGGLGLQGQGLGRQPATNSFIWSLGPTAVVPIMDFGRIDSMIELENYRTKEQFYNYERTVLGAIEEVDNAADNYVAQRGRLDQLGQALDASKRAVALASGRYERGLIDFLNVLDAQRQLFELQDQYTVAQQAEVEQYIAVYKALGGGWQNFQQIPPLHQPLPAVMAAVTHVVTPDQPPYATEGDGKASAKAASNVK
jgi:NodT family efflux transporter outer membrane factor (OMF) lipoprotein